MLFLMSASSGWPPRARRRRFRRASSSRACNMTSPLKPGVLKRPLTLTGTAYGAPMTRKRAKLASDIYAARRSKVRKAAMKNESEDAKQRRLMRRRERERANDTEERRQRRRKAEAERRARVKRAVGFEREATGLLLAGGHTNPPADLIFSLAKQLEENESRDGYVPNFPPPPATDTASQPSVLRPASQTQRAAAASARRTGRRAGDGVPARVDGGHASETRALPRG